MVVLLPAPLGPRKPKKRPRATLKVRPSTAVLLAEDLGQAADDDRVGRSRRDTASDIAASISHYPRACSSTDSCPRTTGTRCMRSRSRAAPRAVLDAVRSVTAERDPPAGRADVGCARLPARLLGAAARAARAAGPCWRRSSARASCSSPRTRTARSWWGRSALLAGAARRTRRSPRRRGFLAFDAPGWARAAMNFSVAESGPRPHAGSPPRRASPPPTRAARRRFGAYWLFVRPGSGLIRRMWLRAVKKRAERAAPVI